uniref:Uncharacterized protein AlNc14C131G6952 n=1 Tax=Albugo laibachii Nc14 TaxID=890382 RepID=F0WK99_9STRA|nr:conserved hypothetical protein [Albugo laibachii Nc14]CCA21874.1 conserved hypothetical protein [Albugo laibachii Nc14]|eukprot:CCA21874.1 conserved hypothetical protein [Albugo laibachii Nc14]
MLGKSRNCDLAKKSNTGYPCIDVKKAASSLTRSIATDDHEFNNLSSPYQPVQLTSKTTSSRFNHVRSRIGKRYQAAIPEMMEKGEDDINFNFDSERENRPAKLKFSAHKSQGDIFSLHILQLIMPDENAVVDPEMLLQYLSFAVTLRACSIGINESKQDVEALALDILHRWDYDVLDAACSLYSRHSLNENDACEKGIRPTSVVPTPMHDEETNDQFSHSVDNMLMAEPNVSIKLEIDTKCLETSQASLDKTCVEWLNDFYICLRQHRITLKVFDQLEDLERRSDHLKRSKTLGPVNFLEFKVVKQMLERIRSWHKKFASIEHAKVSRGEVQKLLYRAEDLSLSVPSKDVLIERLERFDEGLTDLMRSLDHGNGRHHSKVTLDTLKDKLHTLQDTKISFNQEKSIAAIVVEAQALKNSLTDMCSDEKVSLPAMREVLAKVEVVPVDFALEIDRLQHKILDAQSWLTKVRKLIPGRRLTRKRGSEQGMEMSNDQRKMELDEIRALVDDNPCGESSEVFEMQDLLDCANAWVDKVRLTLEKNPSDVSLIELQDLMEEASLMPVEMEESQYVIAEVEARMWCDKANAMLQNMRSLEIVEEMLDQVEKIRAKMTVKRRSRWKPQSERDLQTAVNIAKRWVNECKDILGAAYFDKVFSIKSTAAIGEILPQLGVNEWRPSSKKNSLSTVLSLIEKASRVPIDLSFYVSRLEKVITFGKSVQLEMRKVMESIGNVRSNANPQCDMGNTSYSPAERFDLSVATSLLEKAEALPFTFDEAIELGNGVRKEKDWCDRVHAALPLRQSRKVRQRPLQITKKDIKALIEESKNMCFNFHSEVQMLQKEIEEIDRWQRRARSILNESTEENFSILKKLEEFDRKAGEKFQERREVRYQQERDQMRTARELSLSRPIIQTQEGPVCKVETLKDAEGESQLTCNSTLNVTIPSPHCSMLIQREAIIRRILKESGSSHRWPSLAKDDDAVKDETSTYSIRLDDVKAEFIKPNGSQKKIPVKRHKPPGRLQNLTLLKPFLDMVEEDIEAITKLEADSKFDTSIGNPTDGEVSVEALAGNTNVESKAAEGAEDESEKAPKVPEISAELAQMETAVKSLNLWSSKLTTILKEGAALNATTPERHLLSLIVETLDWLERSRGFFHDNQVAVLELVHQGEHLQEAVVEFQGRLQSHCEASCSSSLDLLSFCLWPLPFLQCEADIVHGWTLKVQSFVKEKTCCIQDADMIVQEGKLVYQINPDSFKLFSEELKRVKSWLLKLKKRLKSYITKQIDRLSLAVAQQLVDDGMETIFALPTIIFLKDQVNAARDWEKRLLESRIETGQAQVDDLSRLLSEYDSSRWVIDLDMHRNVLQTATERYCICRQPYSGFMIGCDHCEDWFHDTCIGLSKERAEKIDHYTCPSCTILLELIHSLKQFKNMASHMHPNGDADMFRIQDEKQYKAALRKLRREEKAAERCDLSLQTCLAHLAQVQTKLDQMSKEAYHSQCVSSESPLLTVQQSCMMKSVQYVPQSIPTTGSPFACKIATASGSGDHLKQNFVISDKNSDPRMQIDLEKSMIQHNSGGLPAMTITTASCMPNILLPSANERAIQSQTKILPAATPNQHIHTSSQLLGRDSNTAGATSGVISHLLPHFLPSVEPDGSQMRYSLSNTNAGAGISGILPGIGPNESLDQRNLSLNLELTKLKAQYAELSEQLHSSRERVVNAEMMLKDLAQRQKTRQECAPIAFQWTHNVIVLVLNQVDFLSASIVERVPCTETADALTSAFIPTAYQQAIQSAKQKSIDGFPQIETIIRLLLEIGWSFVMVCLLQKRPHRNSIVHAIRFAVHHKLYGSHKTCSLYAQLRTLVLRSDLWITKVHKCIEKFNSITSQKQGRLRQAINEYTKLPLTYGQLHEELVTFAKLAEDAFDGMNSDLSSSQQAIEDRIKTMPTLGMLGCSSSGGSTPSKQASSSRKRSSGSSASPRPKQKRKAGASGMEVKEASLLPSSTTPSSTFGHNQLTNSQNASKRK